MAKKPHHTGGWGGLGNTKFPGGSRGGGGGGGGGQHHRAPHHHHTGGWGGLGNKKFPGGSKGKGKPPVKPGGGKHPRAKKHPKRTLSGAVLDGWWITGGNDIAGNCASVAVANSRLLATGLRLGDGELLRLHDRAGPLSIPEALAALGAREFTETGDPAEAAVIGLGTPHGLHAALWTGGGLVTWGRWAAWPDDWMLDEAWAVTW